MDSDPVEIRLTEGGKMEGRVRRWATEESYLSA